MTALRRRGAGASSARRRPPVRTWRSVAQFGDVALLALLLSALGVISAIG
jgi:hypothetical protein